MNKQKKLKEKIGIVVSIKMKHTVVVQTAHQWRHPLYKKTIRRDRRFAADVGEIELKVGDNVRIVETKPMSKTKHYQVVEKL